MTQSLDSLALRSRQRLVMLAAVLVAAVLVIIGRLVYWQVLVEDEILVEDRYPVQPIMPRRGTIFDRRGYPLAIESYAYTVSASPNQIQEPVKTAQQLASWLDIPMESIWNAIRDPAQKYALLARDVDVETGQAIADLNLPGIELVIEPQRSYPNGALAGHVLGFINQQGVASYGLEEYYDSRLVGHAGSWGGEVLHHRLVPAEDGHDLVLTIDRVIQVMVEERLAAGVERYEATGGTVVVMDPKTGAILAMASNPPFDPNQYATTPEERWANPALSLQYEPGSVIKVLTVAAGIDVGVITPDSTYEDTGSIEYGGARIANWDKWAHGTTSIRTMLERSLNLGAIHVADLLGPERFYRYMFAFGLNQQTRIDLAGESPGLVRTPKNPGWYLADLATNSFGQGMAATPLQVTVAVGAIANQGRLMRPYVVDRMVLGGEDVYRARPIVIRQVISPETAATVTDLMVSVVEDEVHEARVGGYTVAGKTGTAQIPVAGGYDPEDTIATFVGFAPAEDPKFVLLVKLDRPNLHRAAWTAAPLFAEIASDLLRLLSVPPDDVRLARTR